MGRPWGRPWSHPGGYGALLEAVLLGHDRRDERLAGRFLRLADRAGLEVAGVLAVAAETALAEAETAALLGDALALGREEDFARGRVHEARRHRHLGLGLAQTDADALDAAALLLVLTAELGDGARDDVLDAEDLAQLRELGRARIGAVALREVLLGQDGVELLALDDAERALFEELVHDLVGHALADVVVTPPVIPDRAVIEVGDRDHGPLGLGRLRRRHIRQTEHADRRRQASQQLHSHLGSSPSGTETR